MLGLWWRCRSVFVAGEMIVFVNVVVWGWWIAVSPCVFGGGEMALSGGCGVGGEGEREAAGQGDPRRSDPGDLCADG